MITISRAKNSEAQLIRKFEQQAWNEPDIVSPYDIAYFVRYGYVFVAKEDSNIIGVIEAIKTRDDEVKIIDWAVAKTHQRRGIGLKLYQKLRQATRPMNIIAFIHHANLPSLRAHKKMGFTVSGKLKDPYDTGTKSDWYWVMKSKK